MDKKGTIEHTKSNFQEIKGGECKRELLNNDKKKKVEQEKEQCKREKLLFCK